MTSTFPDTTAPYWGCHRSVIRPVAESSPPEKLRGSSSANVSPSFRPPTRTCAEIVIAASGQHVPAGARRTYAISQGPERDLDIQVARRVVGPFSGVRHDRPRQVADDGRHIGASVDDERDALGLDPLQPATRAKLVKDASAGADVDRNGETLCSQQWHQLCELIHGEVRCSEIDRSDARPRFDGREAPDAIAQLVGGEP